MTMDELAKRRRARLSQKLDARYGLLTGRQLVYVDPSEDGYPAVAKLAQLYGVPLDDLRKAREDELQEICRDNPGLAAANEWVRKRVSEWLAKREADK